MSEYFCIHQEHDWKDDQEDIVHLKQVVTSMIKMSPGKTVNIQDVPKKNTLLKFIYNLTKINVGL